MKLHQNPETPKGHVSIKGQAMAEYLVGLLLVMALIAVPFEGQDSVVVYFLEMVKLGYQRFFTAIALP
jgi:hypothetical protein